MQDFKFIIRRAAISRSVGKNTPYDRVVVPDHRVVKKGALRGIIRDAGLTVEEFDELL